MTRLDPPKRGDNRNQTVGPLRADTTWVKVRQAKKPVVTMATSPGQVGIVVVDASSPTAWLAKVHETG